MELRHFRYFREVATSLSFSRAAERLHVAQPALSRQVKALEDELGVKLLDRNRVRVQLTDAGRLFLSQVEKVLAQVDMAVAAVQDVPQGEEGHLIICTDWKLPLRPFTEALIQFRQKYPRVEFDLREMTIIQHIPTVLSGKAHLGVATAEFLDSQKGLSFLPLISSGLVIMMSRHHPLAERRKLRMQELREETWVWGKTIENDDGYRRFINQTCREAGFSPRYGKSSRTLEGVFGLVEANFGIALMPRILLGEYSTEGLRIAQLEGEPIEIGMVWRTDHESQLLRNFLALLRKNAGKQP